MYTHTKKSQVEASVALQWHLGPCHSFILVLVTSAEAASTDLLASAERLARGPVSSREGRRALKRVFLVKTRQVQGLMGSEADEDRSVTAHKKLTQNTSKT